jgi:DNA-directed RNA polymerase specialized sigma24 family protein
MVDFVHTNWPPLETGYTDEFGPIDAEAYQVAGHLWRQAESFARSKLGDEANGLRLLLKAAAQVSRLRAQQPDQITNLTAYLQQTYKRLVLAELEKENGHRQREEELARELSSLLCSPSEELDRKILIQQLVRRMDEWTRQVFEWLALGHSFEEIGRALGRSPHATRNKYHERLKRLMQQIAAETEAAEKARPGSESRL